MQMKTPKLMLAHCGSTSSHSAHLLLPEKLASFWIRSAWSSGVDSELITGSLVGADTGRAVEVGFEPPELFNAAAAARVASVGLGGAAPPTAARRAFRRDMDAELLNSVTQAVASAGLSALSSIVSFCVTKKKVVGSCRRTLRRTCESEPNRTVQSCARKSDQQNICKGMVPFQTNCEQNRRAAAVLVRNSWF